MGESVHDEPKIMTPFTLYHHGNIVTIFAESEVAPIIRLCTSEYEIFLLSKAHELYKGSFSKTTEIIHITPIKSKVTDLDLWKGYLYIVIDDGSVYKKRLVDTDWMKVSVENEFGGEVFVQRLKVNSIGMLFITAEKVIYGAGTSGKILTSDKPIKLQCFEGKRAVDMSAGEDFFTVLTNKDEVEEEDEGFSADPTTSILEETAIPLNSTKRNKTLERTNTEELDFEDDDKTDSKDSLISKSSESCDVDDNVRILVRAGQNLIKTSVCSFGNSNNGVLGTGDHIKRAVLNGVLGLQGIGVCSVSSGQEHSLARTIDGRLFHWGLNSQTQIANSPETVDFSAPKELVLSNITKDSKESYVLDACCGSFSSVVLKQDLTIKSTGKNPVEIDFVLHSTNENKFPTILSANNFVLQNHKTFAKDYQSFLVSMQAAVRNCINFRDVVNFMKTYVKPNTWVDINFRPYNELCQAYLNLTYILAACLQSVEDFYRGDVVFEQILFILSWKEVIKVFETYSKLFCDTKSIRGFSSMAGIIKECKITEEEDCEKMFAAPFGQISNIMLFIEHLIKGNPEAAYHLSEKLSHWKELKTKHLVDMELADHTDTFWCKNAKYTQIQQFKKKHRRVILDSGNIPLKRSHGGTFSTQSFILFSDCLCQHGSQLQIMPLNALWAHIDGDNTIKVITPEGTFELVTRSHDHKMIWFDQIEGAIKGALGRPVDEKLSSIRVTAYNFSEKHPKYPAVRCYGRWKLGVMHGTCSLEYPDGKMYFGEMKHSEITGYGKMVLPSLGMYEGAFLQGKFHGYGVYEMKDNKVYEGNFRDGLFHGHGVLRTNSYTYMGDFAGNAKNGYGVQDDIINGHKYMGMFAEGKRTGAGVHITMNGDYFEGIFANDELCGEGLAVFENGSYYEGELTLKGPAGKGIYCLPHKKVEQVIDDDEKTDYMLGNVISGNLGGDWIDVRVLSGSVSINQKFPKYPKTIGELVVDNARKWRSLFDNWEEQVFQSTTLTNFKHIWNKIAIFITNQRERAREQETSHPASYFAKNITLQSNYVDFAMKLASSPDKLSLKSTSSLYLRRSPIQVKSHRKSYSNETLFDRNDQNRKSGSGRRLPELSYALINFINGANLADSRATGSINSLQSTQSVNNNSSALDCVPNYGITALNENDVNAIKEYLAQAFRDAAHPLSILNERITNCFYTSYGCWKVKPTLILTTHALLEWESICSRIYGIVRKLFPALPVDCCSISEGSPEIVSCMTLLYPIVLSEGIYSTLFVLYAKKHSEKDEIYRQKVLLAERKSDEELVTYLGLDSSFAEVVRHDMFKEAAATLKQVAEKYCPQSMLHVIEKSMHLIEDAYKNSLDNSVILSADSVMPLAIYLVLRAEVPHLGAELALLEDLTRGGGYESEMSGFAGYCYTSIKAAYEHIISGRLEA